ncbi:hypothetical protein KCW44_15530, partial [Staphylococcus aureus]|nr:hypothetical protein [Staphylococcus aureus]
IKQQDLEYEEQKQLTLF